MGVCCSPKREFYTDVDKEEELDARKYEEQKLGAFKMTFSSYKAKLNFHVKDEKQNKVIPMLKEELGNDMAQLVQNSKIFKEGDSDRISVKKLRALGLLLTRPEKVHTDSKNYIDKATYLIQEILVNEEEDLKSPIEVNNSNLKEVLSLLVEVALDGITKSYLESNGVQLRYFEEIFKLRKENIVEFIIKNVTMRGVGTKTNEKEAEQAKLFNFSDLNSKFEADKWFLTSGYIRELAYDLVMFSTKYQE